MGKLSEIKQKPAFQFQLIEDHFNSPEKKDPHSKIKPNETSSKHLKKVQLSDLRMKRTRKNSRVGYVSAGEDSDVPYGSDNNIWRNEF